MTAAVTVVELVPMRGRCGRGWSATAGALEVHGTRCPHCGCESTRQDGDDRLGFGLRARRFTGLTAMGLGA